MNDEMTFREACELCKKGFKPYLIEMTDNIPNADGSPSREYNADKWELEVDEDGFFMTCDGITKEPEQFDRERTDWRIDDE